MTLANWLITFEREVLSKISKGEKICFIGHSLGCVFILQALEKYKLKLDSAIFVGAFLDCLPTEVWPYTKIIADFGKTDFEFEDFKKRIGDSYVIFSDSDPYVPNRQSRLFGKALDSSMIKLRNAGHMNSEVNLDEFSLVLDLCLTRLDLSYTQKYRFLNRKVGAYEYIYLNPGGGSIALDAKSSSKEGLFHFRDVQKEGFATQFTGFNDIYGSRSDYMKNSRQAAKRMTSFVRVILVEKIEDLKLPEWQDQMRYDLQSGIKIYLCLYNQVRDNAPEPDFGIWDNNHVVIGQFDWKSRKATKVVVDSTVSGLKLALKWRDEIMKKATPVSGISDMEKFIARHQDGKDIK